MKAKKRALRLVLCLVLVGIFAAVGVWFFAELTRDRSGWIRQGDDYSYLDRKGNPVTGWFDEADGSRYYFDADGRMVTYWQELDGSTYYFGAGGIMRTGWQDIDGSRWYFRSDGSTVSGWYDVDGIRRYFLPSGQLASGWQEIDGSRCLLSEEGALCTGWTEMPEGTYLLDDRGCPRTGIVAEGGNTYYLREDSGLMLRNDWMDVNGSRYYFGADGTPASGMQQIGGNKYFFGEDGSMQRGWIQQGEYRYYFKEDGAAAVRPTVIDGQTCYFTPEGINIMLVNYANPLPQGYTVNLVKYGRDPTVAAEIKEPLQRMIEDCMAATGIDCWLTCGYRTYDQQNTILDNRTQEYMQGGMTYDEALAKSLETVAVPGYSEHQTGYAVDVGCNDVEHTWFHEHCWEYGFILRYPTGKANITHIVYEQWHYRYVGVEVAMAMKDTGLCLEEYLGAA